MQQVVVIGLDGVPPSLVFDVWRDDLPCLRSLMEGGAWGTLRSCHPPITVPAWASMLSGKDPGELGLYGFRDRRVREETSGRMANSTWIREPRVWDWLGEEGRDVILLGVPPTYPVPTVRGHAVSCFLTPSTADRYTHPTELAAEIESIVPGYAFDVEGFRDLDRRNLARRIEHKTRQQFDVARHLVTNKRFDLFLMVEMGPDRMHHAFWRHMDPRHPRHEPGSEFEHAIRDYYQFLDRQVGDLLECIDPEAVVMIVSDHGAKRMDGGIFLNEWLIEQGYLVLHETPASAVGLDHSMIDWSRTKVWGEGGYCGRVFVNLRGREPHGIVESGEYETLRTELALGLGAIPDANGKPLATRVCRPEEIYREVRGVAPDLIAYFDDLHWRALGSVGGGRLHSRENDLGADDANHDWDGLFIVRDGRRNLGGRRIDGLQITQVASILLRFAGIDVPDPIEDSKVTGILFDDRSLEGAVRQRLESLGYI